MRPLLTIFLMFALQPSLAAQQEHTDQCMGKANSEQQLQIKIESEVAKAYMKGTSLELSDL